MNGKSPALVCLLYGMPPSRTFVSLIHAGDACTSARSLDLHNISWQGKSIASPIPGLHSDIYGQARWVEQPGPTLVSGLHCVAVCR
jgi:hypothetical protein